MIEWTINLKPLKTVDLYRCGCWSKAWRRAYTGGGQGVPPLNGGAASGTSGARAENRLRGPKEHRDEYQKDDQDASGCRGGDDGGADLADGGRLGPGPPTCPREWNANERP